MWRRLIGLWWQKRKSWRSRDVSYGAFIYLRRIVFSAYLTVFNRSGRLYNCNFYRFEAIFGLFRQISALKRPHSEFSRPIFSIIMTNYFWKIVMGDFGANRVHFGANRIHLKIRSYYMRVAYSTHTLPLWTSQMAVWNIPVKDKLQQTKDKL